MTYEEFKAERNDAFKGELEDCSICGYEPDDYFDLVEHRANVHDIEPGKADTYE